MLILTRKQGERIYIGDDVSVVINQVSGNRVVVGIEAPNQTSIQRCNMKNLTRMAHEPRAPR